MQQFDLLEIRKNVEETRLVFAQKIEKSLCKKLTTILNFFREILAAKSTAFFGSLIIVAISVLVRSSRDMGHDSSVYLEVLRKMLTGGRYFYEFFEFNLPFTLLLNAPAYYFAQFFSLNTFAIAEVFINFAGILSIYFSSRILSKSDLAKDRIAFNLVILSFACGFFLRVFDLYFNEFLTKSSYFLIFAFPYISYHFIDESRLKNLDQILIGILAAMIFLLKPHYGILVIVFELEKLLRKKSFKSGFCPRNYTTLLILIGYLLFLSTYFSDYIEKLPEFFAAYYVNDYYSIFIILKEDIFPLFLVAIICFSFIRESKILWRFFLAFFAISLAVLSEVLGGYDQRFIAYSAFLPLLLLLLLHISRSQKINWRQDWFFLLIIFLVPQFDAKSSFAILLNFAIFWWVMVLFFSKKERQFLLQKNQNIKGAISRLLLLQDNTARFCFAVIVLCLNWFLLVSPVSGWIISTIILILLVRFYQKKYEENFLTSQFSRLSACAIFAVVSYILALHLSAIFNSGFCDRCKIYKSPNSMNSEFIKIGKTYSNKDEDVVIISASIPESYPQLIYMGKKNLLPFSNYSLLFQKISDHKNRVPDIYKYQLSAFEEGLKNKNTKLLFIEKKNHLYGQQCSIELLEYYLRDDEFRNIFLKNYVFLNRVIDRRTVRQDKKFLKEDYAVDLPNETKIIERDFEVYIRKQR